MGRVQVRVWVRECIWVQVWVLVEIGVEVGGEVEVGWRYEYLGIKARLPIGRGGKHRDKGWQIGTGAGMVTRADKGDRGGGAFYTLAIV